MRGRPDYHKAVDITLKMGSEEELRDDFDQGALDTTIWEVWKAQPHAAENYSVHDTVLELWVEPGTHPQATKIQSKRLFTPPFVVAFKAHVPERANYGLAAVWVQEENEKSDLGINWLGWDDPHKFMVYSTKWRDSVADTEWTIHRIPAFYPAGVTYYSRSALDPNYYEIFVHRGRFDVFVNGYHVCSKPYHMVPNARFKVCMSAESAYSTPTARTSIQIDYITVATLFQTYFPKLGSGVEWDEDFLGVGIPESFFEHATDGSYGVVPSYIYVTAGTDANAREGFTSRPRFEYHGGMELVAEWVAMFHAGKSGVESMIGLSYDMFGTDCLGMGWFETTFKGFTKKDTSWTEVVLPSPPENWQKFTLVWRDRQVLFLINDQVEGVITVNIPVPTTPLPAAFCVHNLDTPPATSQYLYVDYVRVWEQRRQTYKMPIHHIGETILDPETNHTFYSYTVPNYAVLKVYKIGASSNVRHKVWLKVAGSEVAGWWGEEFRPYSETFKAPFIARPGETVELIGHTGAKGYLRAWLEGELEIW